MNARILNVALESDQDVVLVRQRARQVSSLLGFSKQDQVRIATAVSEVARGASQSGPGARAVFALADLQGRPHLEVSVAAAAGGLGQGNPGADPAIVTAHRLMDGCEIADGVQGLTVVMRKVLPPQPPLGPARLAQIGAELAAMPSQNTSACFQAS